MYEHRALPIYTQKKISKSCPVHEHSKVIHEQGSRGEGGDAGMTKPWDDGKGGVLASI